MVLQSLSTVFAPGQKVGEYTIEAAIGSGGMAQVYRGRHSVLDTVHALKVLDPKYRSDPEVRKRFLDEAKIQAKHLDHPNIVKVTNIVANNEVAALVMNLVDGGNLQSFIENSQRRPSPAEFMEVAVPILQAIGHAHARGVIHRDIKPANILLSHKTGRPVPFVTDFGVAKVNQNLSSKKKSTHADARMGTLHYMSPEQIRQAKNVTLRSDIFSLGAMFYEMATGSCPFDADSDYDLMEKIVRGSFEPLERVAPESMPPAICNAISRALQTDPNERFASCEDFIAALCGAGARVVNPEVEKTPTPWPAHPQPVHTGRQPIVGVVFAVVAVCLLLTGALSHSWWTISEGQIWVGSGLTSYRYCLANDCRSEEFADNKPLDDETGFTSFGAIAYYGSFLLGALLVLAVGMRLRNQASSAPVPVARAAMLLSGLMLVAGLLFLALKPSGMGSTISFGFYVYVAGAVAGIVGSAKLYGFGARARHDELAGTSVWHNTQTPSRLPQQALSAALPIRTPTSQPELRQVQFAEKTPIPGPRCRSCSRDVRYIAQYQRHYCDACRLYL